ncbi:MAG: indole-3-glycerol phosphate synthase TrpC [Ignavibacteriae bacterium]|nr:indole-3-glycerol phosphate synthase TrpC [Ignavibacteria bacterium]MBI3363479.1 indole-3-glycerol phosphate synthase TrpC [Ignavibacteriota bacterium]
MNILQQIVEHKREEIAARKQHITISDLAGSEYFERETFSLRRALNDQPVFGIIAEIKRASPSGGSLNNNVDPRNLAREYEEHGAAGISVLTDERFFSGSLDDVKKARSAVSLPILRKDFILDEYQLFEAKSAGADAVLLISAILEKSQLRDLHAAAKELGLEALVELYETDEIDKLDFDRMKLIGVNNRDLRTFTIDVNHSIELAKLMPSDITFVSESGIYSSDDLKKLSDHGIRAALIGEYFMKSDGPGKVLAELLEGLKRETTS